MSLSPERLTPVQQERERLALQQGDAHLRRLVEEAQALREILRRCRARGDYGNAGRVLAKLCAVWLEARDFARKLRRVPKVDDSLTKSA